MSSLQVGRAPVSGIALWWLDTRGRSPLYCLGPRKVGRGLVIGHSSLEEVALFLEVDGLGEPWEGVLGAVAGSKADPLEAAVGDVADVVLEHRCRESEHSLWKAVGCVTNLEFNSLVDEVVNVLLEFGGPKIRVLLLDRIDQIDSEV